MVRKNWTIRALALSTVMQAAIPAFAATDLTAAEAVAAVAQNNGYVRAYVDGVASGVEWSENQVEKDKGTRLFCAPPNLDITSDQRRNMLQSFLQARPDAASHSIGLVMLYAYKYTFPCS